MSKLTFYGREGMMVRHPNAIVDPNPNIGPVGHPARYIGYRYSATAKPPWILTGEPDSVSDDGSAKVEALIRECKRDQCLYAADKYTAERCGLELKSETKPSRKSDGGSQ